MPHVNELRRSVISALIVLLVASAPVFAEDFIRYTPPSWIVGNQLLLPPGTAAAPSWAFANNPSTGFYWDSTWVQTFTQEGTKLYTLSSGDFRIADDHAFQWSTTASDSTAAVSLQLIRDADNILALRNSTNAETFRDYGTYTDASNYTRFYIAGSATGFTLGTEELGTGAASATRGFIAIKGSKIKALTESSATAAWDCALAAGEHAGGFLYYCVFATDGTDNQTRCAEIRVAANNKAGTTTITMSPAAPDETNDDNAGDLTAGTLTYAVTAADTTNSFSISIDAVSSLTQTTLQSESRWNLMSATTECTPQ